MAGWCLIWAYMFIGTAGVAGFTIFAQQLLAMMQLNVPAVALFAVCAAICWYCAYKDVRLSAVLMLVLEGVSVALITILAFIVLGHHTSPSTPISSRSRAIRSDPRPRRRRRDLQPRRLRGCHRVW